MRRTCLFISYSCNELELLYELINRRGLSHLVWVHVCICGANEVITVDFGRRKLREMKCDMSMKERHIHLTFASVKATGLSLVCRKMEPPCISRGD